MMKIICYDSWLKRWILLENPVKVYTATNINMIIPALEQIEDKTKQGYYAAGYLSYEASPAFDAALTVDSHNSFPLLNFGIFNNFQPITIDSFQIKKYKLGTWQSTVSRQSYFQNIDSIKNLIARGQTYQVNYTFRLNTSFKGDASSLFFYLLESQKTKLAMFMEWQDYAICSVSPELFFQLDGDLIKTKPMKGTASRGRYLSEDVEQASRLKRSEKDRAENVMIVDMVRNDLGRIAQTDTVKVNSLYDVEQYKTAWQMTSSVTAKTSALIPEIFTALFPCASITGAPKASTMKIISHLEKTPRKIYTGAMGLIHPNRKAQFNVAIRTVLIDKRKSSAEYGIGGGIVWDSNPEMEYSESKTKAQVLFSSNDYFELLETMLWQRLGGIFLLESHMKRMRDSAAFFGFIFPEKDILSQLYSLSKKLKGNKYKIRLLLGPNGQLTIQKFQLVENNKGPVLLGLSHKNVDSSNPMLFHKTTQRSFYEKARSACPDCDDVVFFNEKGEATESSIYNIVVKMDEQFITPHLNCGLLPGTYRQYLLDKNKIFEGIITRQDLLDNDIFVINSVQKRKKARLL